MKRPGPPPVPRDPEAPGPGRPPPPGEVAWHALSAGEVLRSAGTDGRRGLSSAEAVARARRSGPNKLAAVKAEPRWHAFLRQYRDPMQVVLLAAGTGSLYPLRQLGTGLLLILLIRCFVKGAPDQLLARASTIAGAVRRRPTVKPGSRLTAGFNRQARAFADRRGLLARHVAAVHPDTHARPPVRRNTIATGLSRGLPSLLGT
jgi:hypothetical protein